MRLIKNFLNVVSGFEALNDVQSPIANYFRQPYNSLELVFSLYAFMNCTSHLYVPSS
jgi:hypothetical protein